MDAKTVFSALVAVLMVGSIVGFTAFYNFPEPDSPGGNGPAEPPTAIEFEASGVEATISEMLPSMTIQAETLETDLVAVNSSVYAIEGMKRVRGRFEQAHLTILGTGFVYVADISFDPGLNSDFVLERLEQETSLRNISGFKYALIVLPETVQMQSVDSSLDLSREYAFTENISDALVGLDSLEDDVLEVGLTATFVGEQATDLVAFEERNITAEPVFKKGSLEAEISSLENSLLVDAGLPYSLAGQTAELEQDINALQQVSGTRLFFSSPEPKVLFEADGSVSEVELEALRVFLEDLNAVVSLENSPLSGSVALQEGVSPAQFAEAKSSVEAVILGLGLSPTVTEAAGSLSGEIALASPDSGEAATAILQLLVSRGLTASLEQPASLSIESVFDPELNSYLDVPGSGVSAFLEPGHPVGETVSVEVSYGLVRNRIDEISAREPH